MVSKNKFHFKPQHKTFLEMKSLYKIVIVGRPNDGKSSIFANFLGDDEVAVSPIPGETKHMQPREINLGKCNVEVIDTPGLQHPETVFFSFKDYVAAGRNPANAFVEEFKDPRYAHDVEIMKALSDADICMLVVNADNFVGHTQKCLLDTFSMLGSGVAVLGLVNRKDDDFIGEWRDNFAIRAMECFEFDAFKTKFSDCARLFDEICSASSLRVRSDLGEVLRALKANRTSLWRSNIDAAAGEILNSLKDLMNLRSSLKMSNFSISKDESSRLHGDFSSMVSAFVSGFRREVLRRFRYSGIRVNAPDFKLSDLQMRIILPNVIRRLWGKLPFAKKPDALCAANPNSDLPEIFARDAVFFVSSIASFSYAKSATKEFEIDLSKRGFAPVFINSEKLARFSIRAANGDESDSFFAMQNALREELADAIMQSAK